MDIHEYNSERKKQDEEEAPPEEQRGPQPRALPDPGFQSSLLPSTPVASRRPAPSRQIPLVMPRLPASVCDPVKLPLVMPRLPASVCAPVKLPRHLYERVGGCGVCLPAMAGMRQAPNRHCNHERRMTYSL